MTSAYDSASVPKIISWIACCLLAHFSACVAAPLNSDVVIYGGTAGGLAAAEAVIREGASVIVVEPTRHTGGMVTGGIAITDTGTPELVGGIAGEFFDRVALEQKKVANPIPQILHFRGSDLPWTKPRPWDFEPKVARAVFDDWVARGRYQLLLGKRIASVQKRGASIRNMKLDDGTVISAKVFIDASYEGDLMSRAGVSTTYGRESSSQYGEKLAGVREPHFVRNYTEEEYGQPTNAYMHHGQFGADIPARTPDGKLLWGIDPAPLGEPGTADRRMQAYCYRLIATQRSDIKAAWPQPTHYHPERYELLLRYIQAHPGIAFARLVHLGSIPSGKFDLNASGPFSIDYVNGNFGYPDASYAERDRVLQDHEDYEKGFLWFLSHDPRVPESLRDDANSWGLANDEFTDTHFWPTQIYVRESRRMIGDYVMTENDILRNNTKDDSVGMGSFVLDSHWVRRIVDSRGFVRIEGHLDESINLARNPYEISYRSLVPKPTQCSNLLVPVCISASHVAICTIRMEPLYMILGHSSGIGAVMAFRAQKPVQEIDIKALTEKLASQGQVLHKRAARK
jgi:hypothetical protein